MEDKLSVEDLFEVYFAGSHLPELAEILGTKLAISLITQFGGFKLEIPTRQEFRDVSRNVAIYFAIKNGVKVPALGRKYGITRQRVWQIYEETELKITAYLSRKNEGKTRTRVWTQDMDIEVKRLQELLGDRL